MGVGVGVGVAAASGAARTPQIHACSAPERANGCGARDILRSTWMPPHPPSAARGLAGPVRRRPAVPSPCTLTPRRHLTLAPQVLRRSTRTPHLHGRMGAEYVDARGTPPRPRGPSGTPIPRARHPVIADATAVAAASTPARTPQIHACSAPERANGCGVRDILRSTWMPPAPAVSSTRPRGAQNALVAFARRAPPRRALARTPSRHPRTLPRRARTPQIQAYSALQTPIRCGVRDILRSTWMPEPRPQAAPATSPRPSAAPPRLVEK